MKSAQLQLPGLWLESSPEWVFSEDFDEDPMTETVPHITVMKQEVSDALIAPLLASPVERPLLVDCTLGFGGHTEALLQGHPEVHVIAFDRDPAARAFAAERLREFSSRLTIVPAAFSALTEELAARGIERVHGVCADLGVSSPQLDEAERGMSFRREGPIDMRMDPTSGETALEMIERLDDEELAKVIFELGEERRSRKIARSIKRAFNDGELHTTLDLRRAIVRAVGPVRVGGVDPATRTFQGLRIAVNAELSELETLLESMPKVLAPGGTAAILSFHSLEDRLVKRAFKAGPWDVVTKRPMPPSEQEEAENVRSRSAKLRIARMAEDEEPEEPSR